MFIFGLAVGLVGCLAGVGCGVAPCMRSHRVGCELSDQAPGLTLALDDLRSSAGEENPEGGPATQFALDFNPASLRFDQVLCYGEAEPGSSQLPRSCRIDSIESLEYPFLLRFRDADP